MEPQKETLQKEYRILKKRGYRYVKRGIFFLLVCLTLGQFINTLDVPFIHILSESLTVVGWVALWKPLEIFLYELPELHERWKRQAKK